MKIVKNIAIALAVILVIAGIGIYFLPNSYTVTSTIVIDRPADIVYSQVADFNKWAAWSPWKEKDPSAKITVDGAIGTEGHKMSWDGKEAGVGSMTLVAAAENESLVCTDVFVKPMEATAKDYWHFESDSGKTKVTWITSGGLIYPKGRLFGLLVDKVVGQTEQHGLENLKKVCEAIEVPQPVAVVDTTTAPAAN